MTKTVLFFQYDTIFYLPERVYASEHARPSNDRTCLADHSEYRSMTSIAPGSRIPAINYTDMNRSSIKFSKDPARFTRQKDLLGENCLRVLQVDASAPFSIAIPFSRQISSELTERPCV